MTSRAASPPISSVVVARGAEMAIRAFLPLDRRRFHLFQHDWSTIRS